MTLLGHFTVYAIRRDHSNRTEMFVINVPEAHQYGFGAQIRIGEVVYGASVHTRARKETA